MVADERAGRGHRVDPGRAGRHGDGDRDILDTRWPLAGSGVVIKCWYDLVAAERSWTR